MSKLQLRFLKKNHTFRIEDIDTKDDISLDDFPEIVIYDLDNVETNTSYRYIKKETLESYKSNLLKLKLEILKLRKENKELKIKEEHYESASLLFE